MSENVELNDAFFDSYAKKVKADEANKAAGNYGGKSDFQYDDVQYVGTDKGRFAIVRLIGAPVGAESQGYKRKPTDPIEILTCEVKDDEGKRFTIKLPLRAADASDNHILIRMYDKVMKKVKVNGQNVFENEGKPQVKDIFEKMKKGGFTPADGQSYTYAAGYKPDRISIYNVIDRLDDWCKQNKHTKILCRDLNIDDQGRAWAKPGLKSFSSKPRIDGLICKYGSTEKYDVGIKRTGVKDNPLIVVNASRLAKADMFEELANDDGTVVDGSRISTELLTSEEAAYEKYDLDKYFSPTPYWKIQKRIGNVFKLCDAQMGTRFTEELEALVKKEKAELEAKKVESEIEQTAAESAAVASAVSAAEDSAPAPVKEAAPATRTRAAATPAPAVNTLDDSKIALLKGWSHLNDAIKARIMDVKVVDGKTEIVWDRKDDLLQCDECGALSPEEGVTHCPVCGTAF